MNARTVLFNNVPKFSTGKMSTVISPVSKKEMKQMLKIISYQLKNELELIATFPRRGSSRLCVLGGKHTWAHMDS